jgi:membrane protein
MFAIAVALLSRLPFFEDVMVQFKVFLLLNLVPEIAGRIITVYMEEFRHNAGKLTGLGVLLLFAASIALMFTVDRAINAIWRVRNARPVWISALSYVALLSTGPFLIGLSVSMTTYLMALSAQVEVPRQAHSLLLQAVPAAMSGFAFFLLYRTVPNRPVPGAHALAGGAVAAIAFEFAKGGFAFYVKHFSAMSVVYGTFAALPLFLLWIYLSWVIVLFGAEITASLEYWADARWKRMSNGRIRGGDAVTVARLLFDAQGRALPFEELRGATGIPGDMLEEVLHHLAGSGLVTGEGRGAYMIAAEADLRRA